MRTLSERPDAIPALAQAFRVKGFEGTSISDLNRASGLGRGSLYHFFPGGKDEMAAAVLDSIQGWFDDNVFTPLRTTAQPAAAIDAMIDTVTDYFTSRDLVCLFGTFTLGPHSSTFAAAIDHYFDAWIGALTAALARHPHAGLDVHTLAADAVSDIQGALILARRAADPDFFRARLERLRRSLQQAVEPEN